MPKNDNTNFLVRAGTAIDAQLIEPLRREAIGRTLIEVNPQINGKGISRVEIRRTSTLGSGTVGYQIPNADDHDGIHVEPDYVRAAFHSKVFDLPRQDYEAFINDGIDIDATVAQIAGLQVLDLEDETIINGWTPDGGLTYPVKGFLQSAQTVMSDQIKLDVFGNAYDAAVDAIGMLYDQKIKAQAFNWVMNSREAQAIQKLRGPQLQKELTDVREVLNNFKTGGPGDVILSDHCPAGKSFIAPIDSVRKYFQLYVIQDITTVFGEDTKQPGLQPLVGTIFEQIYPHFRYPESIVKFENIVPK